MRSSMKQQDILSDIIFTDIDYTNYNNPVATSYNASDIIEGK